MPEKKCYTKPLIAVLGKKRWTKTPLIEGHMYTREARGRGVRRG